jgi:hypothetical protein
MGAYGTNQSDGSDRTNRQRFRSLSHFSDLGRPIGAYWSLWVANRRFAGFPTDRPFSANRALERSIVLEGSEDFKLLLITRVELH